MGEVYDVIVVGAGYGGVTAAARLAHAGKRVLLVDKNRIPGGKAMTVRRSGARFELWPIAGGPAAGSRFHELAELVGSDRANPILQPEVAAEFVYLPDTGAPRSFTMPARPVTNPLDLVQRFSRLGVHPARLTGLLPMTILTLLWPSRSLAALDRISMLSWLRTFRLPAPMHSFIAALMNLLFVVPVDRLPVSAALRTTRDFFRGGAGRYHAGGFGSIAEDATRFVTARGGSYLPSTRVRRILVEHGRVRGVETARGVHYAPVVISNAGIQPTVLGLVGADRFPSAYAARIRSLEPSLAFVGVRYHLDAPVFRVPMTMLFGDRSWWDTERFEQARRGNWPRDPLIFAVVPALYDPELAGERERQVALIGTLCSPDPTSPMSAEAIRRVDEMVARHWPELPGHTVHRAPFSAAHVSRASRDPVLPGMGGECIGLAQVIGQCGRSKPCARAPIPGLYYVGCDAGGYGCGTHQAVDSGFRVADLVLSDDGALE